MLEGLAKLPDHAIDLSDIPERTDWRDAERGKFYRPVEGFTSIGAGESDLNGEDSESWLLENWNRKQP